ncbi:unnamed protein product [Cyclocybe aegerita]|uniref:Uncharacterized protein n=1 Tax=Cyclocybe aegerita TaxID=1973307 RepID=A0A8S0VU79_CYCAE|nr:unnamed protein product [Cyclocybe aegerita]
MLIDHRPAVPNDNVYLLPGPYGEEPTLNDFLFDTHLPDGWKEYTHPDGLPYFHHEKMGVVTEVDVRDSQQLESLQTAHEVIMKRFQQVDFEKGGKLSERPYELYISTRNPEQPRYYFVWVTDDIQPTDYNILIRKLFYAHLASFPCHTQVPEDGIQYLRAYLAYIVVDDLTTPFKITPWDPQKAALLLDTLDRTISRKTTGNGLETFSIAQPLVTIYSVRALHRHGTQAAINEQHLPPYPTTGPFDAIFQIFSFFVYSTYEDRLRLALQGELASEREWHRLMTTLVAEWSYTNLLATVVLVVDMAFLALNLSVFARTSSIASTLFAIGSIVIGLHHVWKHRDQSTASISELSFYIQNTGRSATDIKRLALLLSLPMIFLLWALLAFTCAVANYAFNPPKAIASYVIPAFVLAVICPSGIFATVVFWNVFKYKRAGEPRSLLATSFSTSLTRSPDASTYSSITRAQRRPPVTPHIPTIGAVPGSERYLTGALMVFVSFAHSGHLSLVLASRTPRPRLSYSSSSPLVLLVLASQPRFDSPPDPPSPCLSISPSSLSCFHA